MSFGHSAFFGLGMYGAAAALLSVKRQASGLPWAYGLIGAGLVAAFVAYFATRLRDIYFVITTLVSLLTPDLSTGSEYGAACPRTDIVGPDDIGHWKESAMRIRRPQVQRDEGEMKEPDQLVRERVEVLTLHRYFVWANQMRDHLDRLLAAGEPIRNSHMHSAPILDRYDYGPRKLIDDPSWPALACQASARAALLPWDIGTGARPGRQPCPCSRMRERRREQRNGG